MTKEPEDPLILTDGQKALIKEAAHRWEITPAECLEQIIKSWSEAYRKLTGDKKRRIPAEWESFLTPQNELNEHKYSHAAAFILYHLDDDGLSSSRSSMGLDSFDLSLLQSNQAEWDYFIQWLSRRD